MIRYLKHPDGRTWRADAIDDGVMITRATPGAEPEVDWVDTWEEFNTPAAYALELVVEAPMGEGFMFAPIPDVHLEIEKAFDVTLPSQVRDFYSTGEYLMYQHRHCGALACDVDFVADSVLGNYYEEHYDSERGEERTFVPISAKVHDGVEDEQQWIGIDPDDETTAVYALYTSGEFELAYPTFAAFIADLSET